MGRKPTGNTKFTFEVETDPGVDCVALEVDGNPLTLDAAGCAVAYLPSGESFELMVVAAGAPSSAITVRCVADGILRIPIQSAEMAPDGHLVVAETLDLSED
jgi:hypothetical protein